MSKNLGLKERLYIPGALEDRWLAGRKYIDGRPRQMPRNNVSALTRCIACMATNRKGFGRYLIETKKVAMYATPENVEQFGASAERLEEIRDMRTTQSLIKRLMRTPVKVIRHVPDSDSKVVLNPVGPSHVTLAVFKSCGLEIEEEQVNMPGGDINALGEHRVELKFPNRAPVPLTINVVRR